jgi:hypothetical protein
MVNTANKIKRAFSGSSLRTALWTGGILFAFAGCSPKIFSGLESAGTKKNISKQALYPVFGAEDSVRVFNMQIDYKKRNFTGLLIVKPEGDGFFRAVFTTLFGMTVFDFSFNETEFNINRCMEQMEKKIVLNLLKKDFRTLFVYHVPPFFDAKVYQGKEAITGYKIKTKDGKGYFLTNTAGKQLQKIEMPGCITLLRLDYQNYDNAFPGRIRMSHPKIKLNMQLDRIEQ